MILNIKIQNYRSFKEEVDFTLVAEPSKSKETNVFVQPLAGGSDSVRLLKTALIYGANAAGKTNLLRCLFEITAFIGKSNLSVGDDIDIYNPFIFSEESKKAPTMFSIDFVGKDNIKYTYEISYSKSEIVSESLIYYPLGKSRELFSRIVVEDSKIHKVKPGSDLSKKDIEVFSNQAVLSKFGKDIPHEIISETFIYLTNIEVVNACDSRRVSLLKNEVSKLLLESKTLTAKMSELIAFADTGIDSILIKEDDKKIRLPEGFPENLKSKILNDFKYIVAGVHFKYDTNNNKFGVEMLPLEEESHGTRTLYSLGGIILKALEDGTTLFIDEIETGLHPFISKFLVSLFQNNRINRKNAQLIFTTHDTNLLDRTLFRKDQVWFAEKDVAGKTDLFSLQDYSDVREDTPFDKWYMAGKFGGVPNIRSLESLFAEYE